MPVERVGVWSITKLDILKDYMAAYASIMNVEKAKWLKSFYYVDAFAGPGLVAMRTDNAADREAEEYLNGSPLRALDCDPKFDHLWFIDRRESKRANLQELIDGRGDGRRADVLVGDCNDLLDGIVSRMAATERALCFLDPYGLQLAWQTVIKLAETRKIDVFVNFSVMGVVRNLPMDGRPGDKVKKTLSLVMANTDWMDNIYQDQGDLFGGVKSSRRPIDAWKLSSLYANSLQGVFAHVSNAAIMTNSKGAPLYALMLASHVELAKQKMDAIIRRQRLASKLR